VLAKYFQLEEKRNAYRRISIFGVDTAKKTLTGWPIAIPTINVDAINCTLARKLKLLPQLSGSNVQLTEEKTAATAAAEAAAASRRGSGLC